MRYLSPEWLTSGLFDFEYKKYMLLAYFKAIREDFEEKKLYPPFTELMFHYQNLKTLQEKKQLMKSAFPKRISEADIQKLKISYQIIVEDDALMLEIESIVDFAYPQFQKILEEGAGVKAYLEKNIQIDSIGIAPLRQSEGLVMVNEFWNKEIKVFFYQIGLFFNSLDNERGVNFRFLETVRKGVGDTYESIKLVLIKKYRQTIPHPATFALQALAPLPLNEALLPMGGRMLYNKIIVSG